MAENLDPEDWVEIMNKAFEYMMAPVYQYEGIIARLMGDAILAFFGAPIAHEDDPQRAVLAGLGIVEGIADYRAAIKQTRGLDFNVRVGINTGLVVVGEVGSEVRMEYTAMGDAVNLAARMEQTAAPGTVQIAQNTYKLIAPLFEFESLGGIEIKGKREPVPTYRVLCPKAQPGRLRGIEGLHSPLVGREKELRALQAGIERLRQGQGQIISVIGEAGLGKSRLIAELRQPLLAETAYITENDQPGVGWYEGRSLSYQTGTPYAMFISLFNGMFRLSVDDSAVQKYEKITAKLPLPLIDEVAPFIATLLEIELTGEALDHVKYLEPPSLRGRTFHAITTLFAQLAKTQPTVVVFDDLHWVDPTSFELIEQLQTLTNYVPLMLIALFRPRTDDLSWRFHEAGNGQYGERYTAITLEPLDESHSRALVANLLHVEDLPEKVRALILTKSEGNPFFVEEVIRSLLDAKLIVYEDGHWRATRAIEHIALPDTLAGVITARLDRLDESSKRVAQTAAVIGREFKYDMLARVYGDQAILDEPVENLHERELIREKMRYPLRLYMFKHALTQETAYASLLLSKRRQLHLRIAECMEATERERINEIAWHYLEAQEPTHALPYLIEAAERAARGYSTAEAIMLYLQALDILKTVDDLVLLRRVYEGLGGALTFANKLPEAIENYQSMLQVAQNRDNVPMQVSARNKLGFVYALRMGQFAEATEQLDTADVLARQHDDSAGLAEQAMLRCMMCSAVADFDGAVRHLDEAAQFGRQLDAVEQVAMALTHIANTEIEMTRYDQAWQSAQEARNVAESIGHREHLANLLAQTIGPYHLRNGDVDLAVQALEESVRISRLIGAAIPLIAGATALGAIRHMRGEYESALVALNEAVNEANPFEPYMPFMVAIPLGCLGSVYLDLGERYQDRVAEAHQKTLKLLEHPGGMMAGGTAWADLGFCALQLGNVDLAAEVFEKGLTLPTMAMLTQKPRFLVGKALVALARGNPTQAAPLVDEAHRYIEERQMKHFYPMVAFAAGEVARAQGDVERALQNYRHAEELAQSMQMRPLLVQIRLTAMQVLQATSRKDEAQAQLMAAHQVVDEMVAQFTDETLRSAYLASTTHMFEAVSA